MRLGEQASHKVWLIIHSSEISCKADTSLLAVWAGSLSCWKKFNSVLFLNKKWCGNLSIFCLVDLCFFCQMEYIHTLSWGCEYCSTISMYLVTFWTTVISFNVYIFNSLIFLLVLWSYDTHMEYFIWHPSIWNAVKKELCSSTNRFKILVPVFCSSFVFVRCL